MIILIDNYDSFTYNLYQYLSMLGQQVEVFRNDKITTTEIQKLKPSALVISPGPGRPEQAGNIVPIIQDLYKQIPILGICLGHQAIGFAFGGKVVHAKRLMHGKSSLVQHDETDIFHNIETPMQVARYHSLVVDKAGLPSCLTVRATTQSGTIMAIQHVDFPVYGIQFHPESILTPMGMQLLENFLHTV